MARSVARYAWLLCLDLLVPAKKGKLPYANPLQRACSFAIKRNIHFDLNVDTLRDLVRNTRVLPPATKRRQIFQLLSDLLHDRYGWPLERSVIDFALKFDTEVRAHLRSERPREQWLHEMREQRHMAMALAKGLCSLAQPIADPRFAAAGNVIVLHLIAQMASYEIEDFHVARDWDLKRAKADTRAAVVQSVAVTKSLLRYFCSVAILAPSLHAGASRRSRRGVATLPSDLAFPTLWFFLASNLLESEALLVKLGDHYHAEKLQLLWPIWKPDSFLERMHPHGLSSLVMRMLIGACMYGRRHEDMLLWWVRMSNFIQAFRKDLGYAPDDWCDPLDRRNHNPPLRDDRDLSQATQLIQAFQVHLADIPFKFREDEVAISHEIQRFLKGRSASGKKVINK